MKCPHNTACIPCWFALVESLVVLTHRQYCITAVSLFVISCSYIHVACMLRNLGQENIERDFEEYVSPKWPSASVLKTPQLTYIQSDWLLNRHLGWHFSKFFSGQKHRTLTLPQVSNYNLILKQISDLFIAKSLGEASSGVLGPIAAMTRHCFAHEFALKIASLFLPLHKNAWCTL